MSSAQRSQLLSLPTARREIEEVYTLTPADRDFIFIVTHRTASNRLGVAVQLGFLRHPGRAWTPEEVIPAPMLRFIADQVDASRGVALVTLLVGAIRRRRIVVPTLPVLERLTLAARARARREAYAALTADLAPNQRRQLDGLLDARGESRQTHLGWVRRAVGAASSKHHPRRHRTAEVPPRAGNSPGMSPKDPSELLTGADRP